MEHRQKRRPGITVWRWRHRCKEIHHDAESAMASTTTKSTVYKGKDATFEGRIRLQPPSEVRGQGRQEAVQRWKDLPTPSNEANMRTFDDDSTGSEHREKKGKCKVGEVLLSNIRFWNQFFLDKIFKFD